MPTIKIKFLKGNLHEIDYELNDTILQLKEKIVQKELADSIQSIVIMRKGKTIPNETDIKSIPLTSDQESLIVLVNNANQKSVQNSQIQPQKSQIQPNQIQEQPIPIVPSVQPQSIGNYQQNQELVAQQQQYRASQNNENANQSNNDDNSDNENENNNNNNNNNDGNIGKNDINEQVSRLLDMGFDFEQIQEALENTENNFDKALAFLLGDSFNQEPPQQEEQFERNMNPNALNQQMQQLKAIYQQNPEQFKQVMLPKIIEQFATIHPEVAEQAKQNPDGFIQQLFKMTDNQLQEGGPQLRGNQQQFPPGFMQSQPQGNFMPNQFQNPLMNNRQNNVNPFQFKPYQPPPSNNNDEDDNDEDEDEDY